MRRPLPPLNSLRLFEAAARCLSFKRAAEELGLTPSAVSHGIQTLERWLGAALFRREPKGLALTDAGARYYPKVRDALSLIAEASSEVSPRQPNLLRISAAPTFAARILLPLLSEFRSAHPDVSVTLDTSRECVDLNGGAADLAVRVGRGGWAGLVGDELLRERLIPVCAPHRLAEFSRWPLAELPLLHVTTVSEDWQRWAAATGALLPSGQSGLRFDTLQMAFNAAEQGLGVAMGRRPLVDVELAAGTLVPLFDREAECESAHWLLSRSEKNPAVQTFRGWLKARPLQATQ